MIKKLILFIITALSCIMICSPVYAMEYGESFPNYVQYSGGGYIEVESSSGTGTIIVPNQFKNDTFGFSGSSFNVFNCSSSTVNGRFILRNGTEYTLRFQGYNNAEIRQLNGSQTYNPITITKILNTNVEFIDNTGQGRESEFRTYDLNNKDILFLSIPILCSSLIAFFLIILIFKKGN